MVSLRKNQRDKQNERKWTNNKGPPSTFQPLDEMDESALNKLKMQNIELEDTAYR